MSKVDPFERPVKSECFRCGAFFIDPIQTMLNLCRLCFLEVDLEHCRKESARIVHLEEERARILARREAAEDDGA